MASPSDDARAETVKQVLTAFDEIKKGVEHLQECIDELGASLPELKASLGEVASAVRVLAGTLDDEERPA